MIGLTCKVSSVESSNSLRASRIKGCEFDESFAVEIKFPSSIILLPGRFSMNKHDDSEFLSRCEESARMLEDWINLSTSEDHAQWNKRYSDINKKAKKKVS